MDDPLAYLSKEWLLGLDAGTSDEAFGLSVEITHVLRPFTMSPDVKVSSLNRPDSSPQSGLSLS